MNELRVKNYFLASPNVLPQIKAKIFLFGYILCHLDAFSLVGVPVPWIGISICLLVCISKRLMPFQGLSAAFALLIALLVMSTMSNWQVFVPNNFIAYRLLNLLSFFFVVNFITLHASSSQFASFLEKNVVRVGVFVAAISVFVFLMHFFELGDLPRNRIGTQGFDQPIAFSFEIGGIVNRALGTFREPSFLALALLLPVIVALKNQQWRSLVLLLIALYLTYSLGSLIAILLGVVISLAFSMSVRGVTKALLTFGPLLIGIFYVLSYSFSDNFFFQRISHVASLGLLDTSRGFIYQELNIISDIWIAGGGIGYFSFHLAEALGSNYPVSTLNLFLNVLVSGGVLALILLLYWFVSPNILIRRYHKHVTKREAFLLLLPLNIFIFLYLTSFEELHIWHAIGLGLCLARIIQIRRRIKPKETFINPINKFVYQNSIGNFFYNMTNIELQPLQKSKFESLLLGVKA